MQAVRGAQDLRVHLHATSTRLIGRVHHHSTFIHPATLTRHNSARSPM
ncbi:hypothetical protein [Streptomyces sp. NPDC005209]